MEESILINGLKNQDKLIFDYLFNYYYSGLCAFSMQYISDRAAVEDLVQDFFVHLWQIAPQIEVNKSLRSYFFSSVKNRCLDYIKHQSVHSQYVERIQRSESEEDFSSEFIYVESELRNLLDRSITELPPRCREIFEMSRMKGFSNAEISDKLGLSKRTVELQISIALKKIRSKMSGYLPFALALLFIS